MNSFTTLEPLLYQAGSFSLANRAYEQLRSRKTVYYGLDKLNASIHEVQHIECNEYLL